MTPLKITVRFKADGDLLQTIDLALSDSFSFSFERTSFHLQRTLTDWIESYLAGKPNPSNIFLRTSPFRQKVTEGLLSIPFGSTLSYSGLAEKIGIPKAVRAVGSACGKNQIPLLIPCHRIVQKNGKVGGFALDLEIKKRLLLFERQHNRIF
jgi:AraC family transcriptional regulator of adaptative response/methylated-DNA-[protein]-cysteine methyltransferase